MNTELLHTFFFLAIVVYLLGMIIWEKPTLSPRNLLASILTPGIFLIEPFLDNKDYRFQSLIIVGTGYLALAIIAKIKDNKNDQSDDWLFAILAGTTMMWLICFGAGAIKTLF